MRPQACLDILRVQLRAAKVAHPGASVFGPVVNLARRSSSWLTTALADLFPDKRALYLQSADRVSTTESADRVSATESADRVSAETSSISAETWSMPAVTCTAAHASSHQTPVY